MPTDKIMYPHFGNDLTDIRSELLLVEVRCHGGGLHSLSSLVVAVFKNQQLLLQR